MFQKHSLNTSIAKILPVILLPLSIAGCYQDLLVADGPGTGGTGPIVITSSDESLSSGKHSSQSLKGIAPPPNEKADTVLTDKSTIRLPQSEKSKDANIKKIQPKSTKTYLIETTNKSDDKQICGNFERTIALITTEGESTDTIIDTNKKPTSINIKVTITNLSNDDQVEVQKNCSSFKVLDSSGNQINAMIDNCDIPTQNLLFLPKQQHNYQLNFDNKHNISPLRIEYTNTVDSADSENACKTFIDIKTSQP